MENETNTNVYEVGFHLVSDISPEEIPARFGDIKSAIESLGGVVISEEMPKEMALAYEMRAVLDNKVKYFTSSFFGWVKFEIDSSIVDKIDSMFASRNDLIRFILVSTVRENTLSPRKLFEKKEGGSRRKKEEKESMPMDTEAVDAQLDKMLVEEAVSEEIIEEAEDAVKE